MKLSKLQPIQKWIKENVTDPKDNCFFYAAALKVDFPELTLMKGPPQLPGETAHFYLTLEDTIIDPTAQQYDFKPKYEPAKEVSIEKNIDFLIKHPLFSSLPKKTQRKARKYMWW